MIVEKAPKDFTHKNLFHDLSDVDNRCCVDQTCEFCLRDNEVGRLLTPEELAAMEPKPSKINPMANTCKRRMPNIGKVKKMSLVQFNNILDDHNGKVQTDNAKRRQPLFTLTEKEKPGLSAVNGTEWQAFTATIDSGASEHVIPPNVVDHVTLSDGP